MSCAKESALHGLLTRAGLWTGLPYRPAFMAWFVAYFPWLVRGTEPKPVTPAGATSCCATGSTAAIWQHPRRQDVVIKAQRTYEGDPNREHNAQKFYVEMQILRVLAEHPRIVKYLGTVNSQPHLGLLFAKAAHGSVQDYLNKHKSVDTTTRLQWCRDAAEALHHCHKNGVFHCDLRPDNMLLDHDLRLSLCDFGGSKNSQYDGEGLPDFGFFDPRVPSIDFEKIDIFGLGSCFYFIMVGHLPHGPTTFKTIEEQLNYMTVWHELIGKGQFPGTSDIQGGDIIQDCWNQVILNADSARLRYLAVCEE